MEFAPHDPTPTMLTEREVALNAILNLHFPEKDKDDHRMLFVTQIPQQDAYSAMMAPTDAPVIRRFSHYEAPGDV